MAQYKNQVVSDLSDVSDWQDWTPTIPNITIGNGTRVARYTQIGKTVHAYFVLTFGSTTSITASDITVSAPVTASSNYVNLENNVGQSTLRDANGSRYDGPVRVTASGANLLVRVGNQTGGYQTAAAITASIPFTWTTGDRITFNATYEAT